MVILDISSSSRHEVFSNRINKKILKYLNRTPIIREYIVIKEYIINSYGDPLLLTTK